MSIIHSRWKIEIPKLSKFWPIIYPAIGRLVEVIYKAEQNLFAKKNSEKIQFILLVSVSHNKPLRLVRSLKLNVDFFEQR